MIIASSAKDAGLRPSSTCRVVEFRARESDAARAASDEHPAIGQQRRGVIKTIGVEAAGCHPTPNRWIVEFRALVRGDTAISGCDEHLAAGQQRRYVTIA